MNDMLFRTLLKKYEADIEDARYKIQSFNGKAPPDNPVPAPLGTTLILFSLQYFKTSLTSFTVSGRTTNIGDWV